MVNKLHDDDNIARLLLYYALIVVLKAYDSHFVCLHGNQYGKHEARITDCATNNLTFEEGKKLVNHIGVAGVSCKRHCPAVISTQFITITACSRTITACSRTIETQPSQQMQSSTDSGYVTATFLLAGISGTLAIVTVTLAVW